MENRELKIGLVIIICLVLYIIFVMPKLEKANVANLSAAEIQTSQ